MFDRQCEQIIHVVIYVHVLSGDDDKVVEQTQENSQKTKGKKKSTKKTTSSKEVSCQFILM